MKNNVSCFKTMGSRFIPIFYDPDVRQMGIKAIFEQELEDVFFHTQKQVLTYFWSRETKIISRVIL